MTFPVPEHFTRNQKAVISEWVKYRSVPVTAKAMKYKSPSYVRGVVADYRDFLKNTALKEA